MAIAAAGIHPGDVVIDVARRRVEVAGRQPDRRAQHLPGRPVPRVEAVLVVGVVPAGRKPGQIQRRRAQSADVAHLGQQPGDDLRLRGAHARVVAEAGRHHRGLQVAHRRALQRLAVEQRLLPHAHAEQLVAHRIVCAVDCGTVVNPDIVAAQMESAIVYGLSAALSGEITVWSMGNEGTKLKTLAEAFTKRKMIDQYAADKGKLPPGPVSA